MHRIVDVDMGDDVLGANRELAQSNRKHLEAHGARAIDFLGGIGSGKTLLIEKLIDHMAVKGKVAGAILGDLAGDDDYRRIKAHGVQAVNINTGKECHLDAHLVDHALEHLDLEKIDVVFVENVGNLICPADFPLGSDMRVVVISVTEGDDMVRKHPILMGQADIIVINKVDLAEYVDVDPNIIVGDARRINPIAKVILTDAKHGSGLQELADALRL